MIRGRTKTEKILSLAKTRGVIHSRDLKPLKIARMNLKRLCDAGKLERVGRGMYSLPSANITEHHGLVLAIQTVPKGVICLLSALRFHELGDQLPHEVWIALKGRAAKSKVTKPKMRYFRFSGKAFSEGIDEHTVEGVKIRVYNVAKTIADSFKYRNQIGVEVAETALREAIKRKKCSMDDLWHYSKICRVTNIMRTYMETIV